MIDLHTHVLPGIDDGASSFEEAVEMCRLSASEGCSGLIATPHVRHARWWNGDRARLEELRGQLQRRVDESLPGKGFRIWFGGEIALNSESVEEVYELPESDVPTLAGSRYVLLEFDWHGLGPNVLDVVYELKIKGLVPIVAHPERFRWLTSNPGLIEELVDRGACLQLTAMSVTGVLGPEIRRTCEDLIEAEMVHFIASDGHDARLRPTGLADVRRQVENGYGPEAARRIFDEHPRAVIDDRPLGAP